jgi:radical SAM superfamily enzyme YgiQ (UPF0313 family)
VNTSTLFIDGAAMPVGGRHVRFSAQQCFLRRGSLEVGECLRILGRYLATLPGLAFYVNGSEFLGDLLAAVPELRGSIACLVAHRPIEAQLRESRLLVIGPHELPHDIQNVFLCETAKYPRMQMSKRLPASVNLIEPDVIADIAFESTPPAAWVPAWRDTIYPIDIPEIEFEKGLDFLLIDCPARNLGLMPNGVGYVHNALKHTDVRYQTRDLDVIIYHRFHVRRLFDENGIVTLPNGKELPPDPWQAKHYDVWGDPDVLAYFQPEIDEIIAGIIQARPKVLGLSIHACNERFSRTVVEGVKKEAPEIVVLVGGFACYSGEIGLRGFPVADYMCIGEADLTVGPLVEALARGERPGNTPGVLSKYDSADYRYLPGPMPHNLDLIEHPRYEWYNLDMYRNYNGYQLTPVIASRGCRWSRCTFCAERFYWRIRSPKAVADELEWLASQGCHLFMFNESDLNGMPELVVEICDEIIRRKLNIKLTGQLRIHRKADRAFYDKLHEAGFVALRFGVDAFSENTLRLQKKGYTLATVRQNLKDCWDAGIFTEVNWVIGVPGETEADIDEGIAFLIENREHIGRLENLNPLILVSGGVYWLEPEKHNIHFRQSQEELYRTNPRAIPAQMWYSTEPYIDQNVRKDRFNRIVLALHAAKFDVSAWADRVIEDVRLNRDNARVGLGEGVLAQRYEGGPSTPVASEAVCGTAEETGPLVSIQPPA